MLDRKFFLYVFIGMFLYSCTFGNEKRYENLEKRYVVLNERVKHLGNEVTKNRKAILNVKREVVSIHLEIEKIKKKLKKERENFNFSGIPPASLLKEKSVVKRSTGEVKLVRSDTVTVKKEDGGTNADWMNMYHRGVSLFFSGKYREAEKVFVDFIRHNKGKEFYAHALFWLGDVYMHLGKLDKAVDMLKECLRVQPDKPVARGGKSDAAMYLLGLIYVKKWKDIKSARFYMTRMKDRFPDSVYLRKLNELIGERG